MSVISYTKLKGAFSVYKDDNKFVDNVINMKNVHNRKCTNMAEKVSANKLTELLVNPFSSVVIYGDTNEIKSFVQKIETNKHILLLKDVSIANIPHLISGSNVVLVLTKQEYYNLRWVFKSFKTIIDASLITEDY